MADRLREVVVEGERPDRFAVRDHGGGKELDVHDAPVLPRAPGDALHVLAGRHALPELFRLGVQPFRHRHEVVEVLAHGVFRRVPEEPLRGRVPRCDSVGEVIGDDDGRRADLEDLLEALRHLAKSCLDPSLRGPCAAAPWQTPMSPPAPILDAPKWDCPDSTAGPACSGP